MDPSNRLCLIEDAIEYKNLRKFKYNISSFSGEIVEYLQSILESLFLTKDVDFIVEALLVIKNNSQYVTSDIFSKAISNYYYDYIKMNLKPLSQVLLKIAPYVKLQEREYSIIIAYYMSQGDYDFIKKIVMFNLGSEAFRFLKKFCDDEGLLEYVNLLYKGVR